MNLTKLLTAIVSSTLLFCIVGSRGIAGNVKLVAMNGNQYWFSSSSPYAPQLNFHLAYQYCRTLGLQLMVLETREEVDTVASYLTSVEGSSVASKKYWTSGNRLGADSWIWMSSGEQLNNTFSEYWLQQKQSDVGTPKQCMSMKTTVSRRTIFSSEDCDVSLPFICEQVRCLYYNYPVTQFPDPNASAEASALRADLEESGSGSGPANSASESRVDDKLKLSADEKLRAQHFISGRHVNSLQEKVVEQDSSESNRRNLDPNTIHRRITLRPVMTSYPPSPDYINSFYRYQSIDYSATSTVRPTFKKTTRQSLWGPQHAPTAKPQGTSGEESNNNNNSEDAINNANENTQENNSAGTTHFDSEDQLASGSSESKNIVYVTSTTVLPKNSTRIGISTTSTVSREQNVPKTTSSSISTVSSTINRIVTDPDKIRSSLEIVKTKGRGVSLQSSTSKEQTQDNGRIGIGSTVPIILIKDGKEVVTDPTTIAFDDDLNNVGGEIDTTVIDTTIIDSSSPTTDLPNFSNNPRSIESSIGRYGVSNSATGKTTSVMQSDIMKMYQFQRSKSPFAWSAKGSSVNTTDTTASNSDVKNVTAKPIGGIRDRRILNNSGSSRSSETNRESRQNRNFTSTRSTTIRPPKIGLAPRLKFIRNRS